MQCKLLAILLVSISAAYADKGCSGGAQEGAQVDRGRYWYTCQDGQLVPKGCFTDDKSRINLKESFKSGSYILECTTDDKGFLSFSYKGCVTDAGKELKAEETVEDGLYWYNCKKEGDHLRMEVGGCVSEGKRFKMGETVEKGDTVLECKKGGNDTCSMCPTACFNQGKRVNVGDSFEEGDYWYMCNKEGGKLEKKTVGCVHEGHRLQDGDRYVQKESVYECAIRKDSEPAQRLVGCHDTNNGVTIERRLHCQYTKGAAPMRYVMKCDSKDNDKTAYMEVIKCYYGDETSGYEIEPGCYKPIDDKLIACTTGGANGITLETFPSDKVEDAYKKGVKLC